MDLNSTIKIPNSAPPADIIISSVNLDIAEKFSITIGVVHQSNGMTLKEHADGIINGTITQTLTREEFKQQYGATDENLNLVCEFVTAYGLTVNRAYNGGANVVVSGTAAQFNSAFGITLKLVTTADSTHRSYDRELSIPAELDGIITFVLGLDDSIRFQHHAVVADLTTAPSVAGAVPLTPAQVAKAYKFPNSTGSGQCVGILEFGGGYTQANLNSTFAGYGLTPPTVISVPVNGGYNNISQLDASVEVMLDISVIGGVVPSATLAVYFAPNSFQDFVNAFNAAIYDSVNNPSVLSLSWGALEFNWLLFTVNQSLDVVFQQAIVLGISIFTATGDFGSKALNNKADDTVQYPSVSPYVTACGGTTLVLNSDGTINTEVVWNQSTNASAGGVSVIYAPPPTWQNGLVATSYPDGTVTALSGRGIPDVAGNADPSSGYLFYFGSSNSLGLSGGTSAVAPLYAGLFARINALSGKNAGFPNVLFYANPGSFSDITSGNNVVPGASPTGMIGYSATVGWDACTGLGSPIGLPILALFGGAALPNNDTLSNLTVTDNLGNTITLSPTFSGGTLDYTGRVGSNATSVSVTPTLNDPLATLSVNGNNATSGQPVTVSL